MNFSHLQLSKQICHRLYIATNGVTRLYRPFLEDLNLTYPQYILMMALWEIGEGSIQEIQSLTQIDAGSLTLILQKLKTKKFLKIKTDKDDKRKKIVSLTATGIELQKLAVDIPNQMFCKINNLSEKDVMDLVRILDKLNDQIIE